MAPPAALKCPPLAAVSGYVIGLPRKATFVDQLTAIERITRASTLEGNTTPVLDLLSLDLPVLEHGAGPASVLLPGQAPALAQGVVHRAGARAASAQLARGHPTAVGAHRSWSHQRWCLAVGLPANRAHLSASARRPPPRRGLGAAANAHAAFRRRTGGRPPPARDRGSGRVLRAERPWLRAGLGCACEGDDPHRILRPDTAAAAGCRGGSRGSRGSPHR